MLRWGLVAITVILLTITIYMFVERFSDDPQPAPPVATAPAPATPTETAPATATPPAAPEAPAPLRTAPPETASAPEPEPAPAPAPASAPTRQSEPDPEPVAPSQERQAAPSQDFTLSVPVACALGQDCFIQQYMDTDPGPGAKDFTCGHLSYQDHSGTDFRVRNLKAMRDGVAVLAARDGVVRALRDGMADVNITTLPAGAVDGRECGNAVVLTHPDGWETQYCHMRNGSVSVGKGQVVRAGDPIGLIGMSGKAQFPHLHLSVRKDGRKIDPYRGLDPAQACGGSYRSLWDPTASRQVAYQPGGILDLGLLDRQLTQTEAESGEFSPATLDRNGQALVAWYIVFGIRRGDVMSMTITGPDGTRVFAQTLNPHQKDQAQYFAFAGRRTPPGGFQPGTYRADVQMIRGGTIHDRQQVTVTLR